MTSQLQFLEIFTPTMPQKKIDTAKVKKRNTAIPLYLSRYSLDFFDFVANSPHHLQISRFLRVDFDFLPNPPNMYGNGIFRRKGGFIPDPFVNLINRKYLACVFHQKLQNAVFRRRHLQSLLLPSVRCLLL